MHGDREQLIRLYTFENDLVLDPFMGSGSALVAAARLGRRYAGYDSTSYVAIAKQRVTEAELQLDAMALTVTDPHAAPSVAAAVVAAGTSARRLADHVLAEAGFRSPGAANESRRPA